MDNTTSGTGDAGSGGGTGDDARFGGVIHTYQRYDPVNLPSPRAEAGDLAGLAMEHMLHFGSTRRLTDEELARAVRIDPSQIAGLGPSLDALIAMLEERRRKILETYETGAARRDAADDLRDQAALTNPPAELADEFAHALRHEQLNQLEMLWYRADEHSKFAVELLHLRERLGEKYQVDQLAADYHFTGRTTMSVPEALDIKEELETIDKLLEQLRNALENAQIALVDLDELSRFVEEADVDQLRGFGEQIREMVEAEAERQGLDRGGDGDVQITPKAYRLFQSRVLDEIFTGLQAGRSGRHTGPIAGEGVVELPKTRQYQFGDSVSHMDAPQSFTNALLRAGASRNPGDPVPLTPDDIEIHETRNNPKCATVVLMDMSGSMRYDGQYVDVKRMALAMDGLIRSDYPGDFIAFVEVYSFAKVRHISEVAELMPKTVTIRDPWVRLRIDMSDDRISESMVHPHFTNIQRGLAIAHQLLAAQDTPNRQIMLLTDGLPTAHFEDEHLYLLYPPDPRTEQITMREAYKCAREGITINTFLLPSRWQSEEDVAFAHRLAESTKGRVLFTAGSELDRFVLWDYVTERRKVIG